MKAFIPGTAARRERLAKLGLQKRKGDHEVLLQIEYQDGTEMFKPADWDAQLPAWVSVDGERFYVSGNGRSQGYLWGVPVVHVDAEEAGVVSAEAAKFASREEEGHYVDEDGNELEVVETDEYGDPTHVKLAGAPDPDAGAGEPELAADGGVMEVGSEVELHHDLSTPDGYAGEVIERGKAGLYDPYPVSRQEADQAVSIAENAGQDEGKMLRYLLIGAGLGAGLIVGLLILQWLMGQIGGSTGGGGGGGGGSGGQGEQLAAQAKFTLQAMGAI